MELIVITQEERMEKEAETINCLFQEGLPCLHLRKPQATEQSIKELLIQIDPAYYHRIVLHDHFPLTALFPLKGVHLNRRNAYPPPNPVSSLSRSCHNLEELSCIDRFHYVFLSPLFDSISKAGYKKTFTDRQLIEARTEGWINRQVIALGGITPDNIPQVREYGFGGVAVLGALWGNYNKDKDLKSLLERMKTIVNKCKEK
ncbi:thiamine phosphate synthase [Parabacteroides sp. 52]|uniref:thiamine phosphate synthase n=1 Tax=unclassified Parabacteroides TaxID=2649774 RepID=UPI0013D5C78E|nr:MULTISPECIES: thiamine phosphate synthase [unclassified Parabacteroides]MDH6533875.1 thiamine-phosphate pyrophosphorylase [Parabacteroides sp. PM5-20]NDV54620.1 thiamine phosphate synthase [Parabacteroides sp. 52]